MPDIDYEKLRERFHYTTGAYISGKIFAEYAFGLSELFQPPIKGEQTKKTKTNEAVTHVTKYINFIAVDLQRIGIDLSVPDNEVNSIENIIHGVLQLNEVNQKRVLGLMNKLKKEQDEKPIS